jgi:hypothetical protein
MTMASRSSLSLLSDSISLMMGLRYGISWWGVLAIGRWLGQKYAAYFFGLGLLVLGEKLV